MAKKGSTSPRLRKNAGIMLRASCLARPGETLLVLTHQKSAHYAKALGSAAAEMGLLPAVMDIGEYVHAAKSRESNAFKPILAAMESSDIVILIPCVRFDRLTGNPDDHDLSLTAKRRWVYLQDNGMEKWKITEEQVAAIRKRTEWLIGLLGRSRSVRVTSPKGTDFAFGLGTGAKWLPILGIMPLYGEVAITPQQGSESGVYVVDGPTQQKVRPADELDREPLRIVVEKGRVRDVSGDPAQVRRLKEFIESGDPRADAIDEIGVLTTAIKDNDKYWWTDGTHHHDRLHIAIGNNLRRDALVHGPKHMDGEVCRPTVEVDGLAVVTNGVFRDELLR